MVYAGAAQDLGAVGGSVANSPFFANAAAVHIAQEYHLWVPHKDTGIERRVVGAVAAVGIVE